MKLFKYRFTISLPLLGGGQSGESLNFDIIIQASDKENAEVVLKTLLHVWPYDIVKFKKMAAYPQRKKAS